MVKQTTHGVTSENKTGASEPIILLSLSPARALRLADTRSSLSRPLVAPFEFDASTDYRPC
jgi:hypothetical protein